MTKTELIARIQHRNGHLCWNRSPAIKLADGETISVQASEIHYCSPRVSGANWESVECGFPSFRPSPALMQYAETPTDPTKTVYGYVPIEIVLAEIEAHGGVHPDDSKE